MIRRLLAACVAFTAASASGALRDEFAWSLPLQVPSGVPMVRLDLPPVVYRDSADPALGDVRVLNGAGELVPFELRRPMASIPESRRTAEVPFFPLRGVAAAPGTALQLRFLDARHATVLVEGALPEPDTAAVLGYLLHTEHQYGELDEITFTWADDTADFSLNLVVSASDDLYNWRVVVPRVPVARLRHGGEIFEQRSVKVPPTRARYWRLGSEQSGGLPAITRVVVALVQDRIPVERLQTEVPATVAADEPGSYYFDLGAQLPVDRVSLVLPDVNTVARAEFLSRRTASEPWQSRGSGSLYRLQSASGELTSAPLGIETGPHRYWLVRVDPRGGGIGGGRPRLRAGWLPDQLVFVTRGSPPFELVFGNAASTTPQGGGIGGLFDALSPPGDAALGRSRLEALPLATAGERRVAGGESRLRPAPPPTSWRLWILWAALLAGVGVLALVAIRLGRQMRGVQSGNE